MKAVILAAGKSTRTYPLTLTKPKPLLKVVNKTLIEHNMEQLMGLANEVIIIVGYKKEMIKKHLGDKFGKIKIEYVEQKQQLGSGHALMQAEKFLGKERFMVMMGDDLYFRGDIRRCLRYPMSVMAKRVENYSNFGVFIKKDEKVLDIVEKPQEFVSDLANAAFYVFNEKIFECLKKIEKSPRGEYELTDALKMLANQENIFCVEAKVWIPIGYPWDLLEADQIIREIDVLTGKNTTILGKISDSSIGENCIIEGDIKNSIIGDNVKISKGSIIADSVIGDNVIFSGKINSSEKVMVEINDKKIQADGFGAAIADDAELINVKIHPGTLIWPGVKKENTELKGVVKGETSNEQGT